MDRNPLLGIKSLGQSIWLDYIDRGLLTNGGLARLIDHDGLAGVTSNPAIFEQAINGHADYDAAIVDLARRGLTTEQIYEAIVLEDIARAADIFRPVYDRTGARDGYVSIEVSPRLAYETEPTLVAARYLWGRLQRPNVMIKVPATVQGLPVIRRLIAEGINVNVTLLFGLGRYREVTETYLTGLEDRLAAGKPLENIASVASFFLSRIDVLVDKRLDALSRDRGDETHSLRGRAAIAYARLAYQIFKTLTASDRWKRLAARGARPQRLLWASTGTKDPAYSDVKYVEPLIGPETINTLPPQTLDAYREHGVPAARLEQDLDEATETPTWLTQLGVDLEAVAQELETEGVKKFVQPFDKLFASLELRRQKYL
jgi:transaldolase